MGSGGFLVVHCVVVYAEAQLSIGNLLTIGSVLFYHRSYCCFVHLDCIFKFSKFAFCVCQVHLVTADIGRCRIFFREKFQRLFKLFLCLNVVSLVVVFDAAGEYFRTGLLLCTRAWQQAKDAESYMSQVCTRGSCFQKNWRRRRRAIFSILPSLWYCG